MHHARIKKIAVLGYGALSHIFIDIWRQKLADRYCLCGVLTRTVPAQTDGLRFFGDLDELLAEKPDYVLEFAGGEALRQYGAAVLSRGVSLVIVSIGALADGQLRRTLEQTALENGSRLYIASGAVGGFDVLRTMALAGTDRLTVENRKPPAGLNGAPYLNGRVLPEDREESVFFGSAREAITAFPKNVNVAVAAALAGSDVDRARVEICSIPGLTQNTHIIRAENSLAEVSLSISSRPDPANPRSSSITAWSVAALLENLESPIVFF